MSDPFIPVNEPRLDGNEAKYLTECITTGWISSEGPFVERLEKGFASRINRQHGIAVCNGTAALEVALAALQIGPADEVILPSFTIISCAMAVIRAGAVPVVVDSDPLTWNMDVSQIKARITSRTKAIMVVHIFGLPVDMDPVLELVRQHGLRLIEDAAQAHGLDYRGQPCGSFGDISTFSFYPNKLITTGEGGIVLCNDDTLAQRCRSFRNLCFQTGNQRFVHEELGWNFRMSNLQAAIGVAQLERWSLFCQHKRQIGQRYQALLHTIDGIQLPLGQTEYAQNSYWVFGIVLAQTIPADANALMDRFALEGIGTRPFFWPMHAQPVLQKRGLFAGENLPIAEILGRRGFYLPSGLGLTMAQQDRVVAVCQRIFAEIGRL